MFSDLVSVAGHIYRFDIDDGLPGAAAGARIPINVHADEFNELMGDEFIPMVNKGGGAGVQVTAYTQTLSDIEARIGNRAKAGQVVGNFNNLFILVCVRTEKMRSWTPLRRIFPAPNNPSKPRQWQFPGDSSTAFQRNLAESRASTAFSALSLSMGYLVVESCSNRWRDPVDGVRARKVWPAPRSRSCSVHGPWKREKHLVIGGRSGWPLSGAPRRIQRSR